jgi:copper transport protein
MSRSAKAVLRLLGVAAALLLVVLPAGPAAAHAVLVVSEPANGAAVAQAPREVQLRFSEDVSGRFSTASLLDSAGRTVPGARVATGRGGPRLVVLQLPALADGTYGVAWRVLAEDDGHTTSGVVVFTVGTAPQSPGGQALQAGAAGDGTLPTDVVRRWLGLCLLAGLVGGLAFAGLVLRPPGSGQDAQVRAAVDGARRRVLSLAAGAGGLAVLAGLVDLGVQAARSAATTPAALAGLLADTRWGHLWATREAVLAVLAGLALALRTPGRAAGRMDTARWGLAAALVTILCTVEALGGHAASVGSARTAAVAAIAAHAFAACVWLGGVACLAVVVARPGVARTAMLRAVGGRFTVLAVGGVGLIVATGIYSAGREIVSAGALMHTPYGRLLLAKAAVLLVAGALGLASAARLHGWPLRLAGPPRRRLIAAEAAVGVALLLVAAALVETPPPRPSAPSAGAETVSRTGSVEDIVVSVSVTPNRPGANGFTVVAVSGRRPPPAPVQEVRLEPAGAAAIPLREMGPGRYFGTAELAAPGVVRATVVVRRAGARLTVPVEWSVPAAAPPAAAVPAAGGLAPAANALVGIVFVVLLGLAVWRADAGRRRRVRPAAAPESEQKIPEDVR